MTDTTPGRRLSAGSKSALLDAMRRTAPRPEPVREAARPATRYDTAFDTLPGYQVLRTQRAAGDVLGIDNPFYRRHDAAAGATSLLGNRPVVNFSSYDYVGLNRHPEITAAVAEAATEWGTSVSASRITAGERGFHQALEREIAELYGKEDALAFVSGHATGVSSIAALMGPADLIVYDQLSHNCLTVGAAQSGAVRRAFPHNDLDALDAMLAQMRDEYKRVLIVTEGLFSMDGDGPDLKRLVEIKERWGAWLMVDEAHSLGVLGRRGLGVFERQGVDPRRVDIWMGTLSKSLVSCGGYIAGDRALVELLKFTASGMVYSVGMPGPAAVAALTALRLLGREPERVARLQANGTLFLELAKAAGLDTGTSWGTAVTPIVVGDSVRTLLLAQRLLDRGYNAFPIIPPGVPERSARLRFFLSSEHTEEQIRGVVAATREELDGLGTDSAALLKARLAR